VKHPNKILWLFHQHRAIYDLYGTEYSPFSDERGDGETRQATWDADTRAIREARHVFSVSRNVARRLTKYNDIAAEPLYHPSPFHQHLHFEEYGDFVFLPTRLELNKRPGLLVEAMALTRSRIKCVIAGNGSLWGALSRDIERLGLTGRVTLRDWITDPLELARLYARCLAVFYGPYDEDYGYVTLEGFGSRKPVLTTGDAGGVLEFVTDGETGFVMDPDPAAIAGRIDELAGSRPLCRRLGEAGHDAVRDISWDHVISRLIGACG